MCDLNEYKTFIKHIISKYLDNRDYFGDFEVDKCVEILDNLYIEEICEFLGIEEEDYLLCPEEWNCLYYERKYGE